ncbi:MAG: tetraacyldisaccharide 4'-kinase [Terriglobales bacterium]
MNVLASIFGLGVAIRNRLYERGIFNISRLQGPVISVGNLSVGGSGKTPFVMMLGELLARRGILFDVLSRGYGRRSRGIALVDPNGSAEEFGDEPILIARKLGVPVIVGEDRFRAGTFAESEFGPQLHLLDDGFQHRALARDFDIVLVSQEDSADRLLPSGRLREPLTSLRRADAVVLTNSVAAESFPLDGKLIWSIRRGIVASDVPDRPIVFCGIGRPKTFVMQLRDAGITPVAESFYRDHHAYTGEDVKALLKMREENGADGFVTTEKDAINLGKFRAALGNLSVVPVTLELEDAANAVDAMLRIIHERRPQA